MHETQERLTSWQLGDTTANVPQLPCEAVQRIDIWCLPLLGHFELLGACILLVMAAASE
ncbi:hypothetical protein CCMA1212_006445 [Trichoderma ghanense]|uniref:Uncharacterized protein n=1 Tax=Trichoderma ghanense TaxID=65468 RepID=A0ABY2H0J3_9HYPO